MSDIPPLAGFQGALAQARLANRSNLCIGLDPDPGRMPGGFQGAAGLLAFSREIIAATSDLVCAYKPNLAFFERFGAKGWAALERTVAAVPERVPVIADAKRGDIGNTSRGYAEAVFDRLRCRACTVSPYLGVDAVEPLIEHPGGFAYILCRTSNPGAAEIQDLDVDGEPLFARVIRLFQPALQRGVAGLVIGARERQAFSCAARLAPNASILVPGIGAQGGTVEELAAALTDVQARSVVVNVSRDILYASNGRDFAQAARAAALQIRTELQAALNDRERQHGSAATG